MTIKRIAVHILLMATLQIAAGCYIYDIHPESQEIKNMRVVVEERHN